MPNKHDSQTDTEKLMRRNRELAILNDIAEALNHEVDLRQALMTTLAKVAELFNLETGWIYLIDPQTGKFYPAATQNLPPALAGRPRRLGGTCYCLNSYIDGDMEGAANVNIITCSRLEDLVDGTDGLRYHASIPLYAYGKELGVLNVASTDWSELSDEDLELLKTIGDLVSISIQRARLFARSARYGALEERARLAREIHDTIAQGLTGISLQLEVADALLEEDGSLEKAREAVQRALDLTRSNLEEARRSVLDLRAAPLEDRSLSEALATLVEEKAHERNLKTTLDIVGNNIPIPLRVEVTLYRIAQEALTNIVRHAHAKSFAVQLVVTPEQARLTIEDDGAGFDIDDIPKGHYGIIGLNERVKLLGGTLEVQSTEGAGTYLEAIIPLEDYHA